MTNTERTVTETAMPATFDELSIMAKAFVASGFFTDVRSISQGIVKVQAGKELGLSPVYSMQNINMIKGRLTTSANTMALLIKRSGRYNYRIVEHTDTVCNIKFSEAEDGKWVDVGHSRFTLDDANRAGLVKAGGSWVMYPRAMLFSRAISQGARLYTPDAIGGVYTTEEMKTVDTPDAEEPWDAPPDLNAGPPDYTHHEGEPPREHWCEEHGTEYFKSANMRSYGHPITGQYNQKGKQVWCHEHQPKLKEPVKEKIYDENADEIAVKPGDRVQHHRWPPGVVGQHMAEPLAD